MIDTSVEAARRAWNAGDHALFIAIIRERNRILDVRPVRRDFRDDDQRDYEDEADAHGVTVREILR